MELSKFGVLVTRLNALHDIASMTVLCSDKTGTLTRNEATVSTLHPAEGFTEEELLRAAWLASDPAGQDPVDGAMVRAANAKALTDDGAARVEFKPFDPAIKRAEAAYREVDGVRVTRRALPPTSRNSAACLNLLGCRGHSKLLRTANACSPRRRASKVTYASRV